jgi:catechol 2,3-dioxygenase-like lactoylglutathione lyase family enzyme
VGLVIECVLIDCNDLERMSEFWKAALALEHVWTGPSGGYLLEAQGPSFGSLALMPCGDEKRGKNRLHLDLRPDNQEAEVRRLQDLGAARVDIGQRGVPWVVMADPEGNEFCVLRSAHFESAEHSSMT